MRCLRCQRDLDPAFKACPHCGEVVTDFARRYSSELLDGKYRVIERLGTGGMGEVFKAVHTFLDAERVIKIIRASIAGTDQANDRFLREARLATKVQHPNVATLHDFAALAGGLEGAHYMVWEYIDGENLAHMVHARGTLPGGEALAIARQSLDGLEAIHRAGIVHRDISPENLMITRDDHRVKIIDLGVAKMDEADQNLTKTGIFIGKLRYASPEHLGFLNEGERIDGRADLYSLAIVIYEMLTGRPPFEATSPHQYLLHHATAAESQAPDLTRVPPELRPVLARALERDRNKRYPTARAFADALNVTLAPSTRIDPEATMRVSSQQPRPTAQTTTRTPLPAALGDATIRATPAQLAAAQTAARQAAAPTVIDPSPAPTPAPRRRGSIAILAPIVLLAVILVMWAMRPSQEAVHETLPTTTTRAAAATQPPSQTTVDVTLAQPLPGPTTTTATTGPTATTTPTTIATSTVAPPAPGPASPEKPVARQPASSAAKSVAAAPARTAEETTTQERAREVAPPPSASPASTYTERGDGDANSAAVEKAKAALAGVTRVSVIGDPALVNSLTRSGLEVVDGADVVVQFNGTLEHLGIGRKRRSAHATVTRHGRIVFRYELPPEDYRVGDTPAEAFARVLRDVFGR